MTELDERFSNALHSTARAWRLAMDRRLKSLGVSQASWMTIAAVSKAQRPLSQSDLAEHLGVEGATMVSMIDRLVKAGLVLREPSTQDRRVKRVVLTEAGGRVFDRVKTEAVALRKELLTGIQPKKLESATELLEQLQGMFDAGP
jgi:MarR family transcriptional regulator, transcriptional regulator for hemolysin